jgi:hypothetical protein
LCEESKEIQFFGGSKKRVGSGRGVVVVNEMVDQEFIFEEQEVANVIELSDGNKSLVRMV